MKTKLLGTLIQKAPATFSTGQLTSIKGPIISATMPQAKLGDLCKIKLHNSKTLLTQVIAFEGNIIKLTPFGDTLGVFPGAKVENTGEVAAVIVSEQLIGQVCNALGKSSTKHGNQLNLSKYSKKLPLFRSPPDPLERKPINTKLLTGISTIDGLLPLGKGQRIGLFAGAGVGKSTLLGMLARNINVDLNVIALVGERGREVLEFMTDNLGEQGLKKTILVVSTSDEAPVQRMLAVYTAHTIAEYFRTQAKDVLLLVDSITRFGRALREVSLNAGELPVRQGYTPSVYSELPKLLERAGNDQYGSITAVYTVLTEGEFDPLGDEVKSLLDGHINLCPELANRGIRPAIDPLTSVSRLENKLCSAEQLEVIKQIKYILSRLKTEKDLVILGGEPDPQLKLAIDLESELLNVLTQAPDEYIDYDQTIKGLSGLVDKFTARTISLE